MGQTGMSGLAPIWRASLWMFGTIASFGLMSIGGRELSADMTTLQILFWRSAVGFMIITIVVTRAGWHRVRTDNMRMHVGRNLAHLSAQFCWFYAIATIPLAEVTALEFMTPIWTVLMAALFLGEKLSRYRAAAVALGFLGAAVIVRPGFTTVELGTISGLGAGIGYAVCMVTARFLALREDAIRVLFYMLAMQLPITLVLMLAIHGWIWPDPAKTHWVFLIGATALTAHYCINRAMQLAEAGSVTIVGFLRLPFMVGVGYIAYGEEPQIWLIVGALIIVGGLYLNVRDAQHRQG